MKSSQITVVQRQDEVAECLPAILRAAGMIFRKIAVSRLAELSPLPDSEIVILDAAADRWGLAAACQLRMGTPGFAGLIVISSFERKADLDSTPDGDVLSAPGVAFVRFPLTPPTRLATIFSTIVRPDAAAVGRSAAILWSRRISARAKMLTHQRGREIGPLRLQLRLLPDAIGTRIPGSDVAAIRDCLNVAAGLPKWAASCDALIREARERCQGTIRGDEIAPIVEDLVGLLRELSADAHGMETTEMLSRQALGLIDSIDLASRALEVLQIPAA